MNRYSEDMKVWLFDLAHGNLKDKDILTGFLKYYVIFDCTMQDLKRDIVFHTNYGEQGCITALNALTNALKDVIAKESEVVA